MVHAATVSATAAASVPFSSVSRCSPEGAVEHGMQPTSSRGGWGRAKLLEDDDRDGPSLQLLLNPMHAGRTAPHMLCPSCRPGMRRRLQNRQLPRLGDERQPNRGAPDAWGTAAAGNAAGGGCD